ncbi:hypothetical protein K438DRAFT_2023370 [Mycena galopus ATCC 62051]|nr:hypothetical protein K438DRAFT_2023370 [Mycena galopus ATCC 62051]
MDTNQSLRDRLAEINAQIALLEAERKTVQKKLQSITYPVLRLPFELTSEIFAHCLPDCDQAEPIFQFKRQELPTPLLLTQICRAWKNVALNTPKMWAIFRINPKDWPRDHALGSRRLAEWVQKAGSSPLSFILARDAMTNYNSYDATSPTILGQTLSLSLEWRLQNLDLRLPHQDLITEQLQSYLHGRLPTLEKLEITTSYYINTVVTAFELAPCLRSVALNRLPPTLILLPWQQLTHFYAKSLEGIDCLHVLRLAVSLVECKFPSVDEDMDETDLLPRHLAMKVLHLGGEYVARCILDVLTLPLLVELDYNDASGSEDHCDFVSFLSRSRPPLSHLSLHSGAYSRILNGCSLLCDLTVLTIAHFTTTEMSGFLHELRVRDSALFLPNLESFTSSVSPSGRYSNSTGINYGDLADALEFRWHRNNPGPRLRSFQITWSTYHDLDVVAENKVLLIPPPDFRLNLARLQDLIEEGMHISVKAEVDQMSEAWI